MDKQIIKYDQSVNNNQILKYKEYANYELFKFNKRDAVLVMNGFQNKAYREKIIKKF